MNNAADATMNPQSGRGCLMVLGSLNILFGFIAIGSPLMTGNAVTIVVGAIFVASGVFELIHAFSTGGFKSGVVPFLTGVLAVVGGGLVVSRPLMGLSLLTLVLAINFAVEGIVRIVWAFKIRPVSGWGWLLFGGAISFMLGAMIWRSWPLSGLWAIGTLVGIRILMSGWTMLLLGVAAGRVNTDTRA